LFLVFVLTFLSGCGFGPTKLHVHVLGHKSQGGGCYALIYQVLEPASLAGRFGEASTMRGDLINGIDGAKYEVFINFTMVGALTQNRPLDYFVSAPQSKEGDFLEYATLLK
jgi:hypothetical protein